MYTSTQKFNILVVVLLSASAGVQYKSARGYYLSSVTVPMPVAK